MSKMRQRGFKFQRRVAVAAQALRARPAVPRPGEIIVDGQSEGERLEIARTLARDGMAWRVLDSRGNVLSIEATRTLGVWLSCNGREKTIIQA